MRKLSRYAAVLHEGSSSGVSVLMLWDREETAVQVD
jgi:hypothetical protein